MSRTTKVTTWIVAIFTAATMVGCGDAELMIGKYRFLSPRDVISTPDHARVGWIIPGLGDGDVDPDAEMLANATRPGPEDWQYHEKDYVIGPTDVLDIMIQDLYASGMETSLRREVSDSGYIEMPQLGERIEADGLTAVELTSELNRAYMEAGILSDPDIAVMVAARRQQTFSALGAIMRPGTYNIVKPDMRLIDVIALSGGITQPDIEYIFVIRQAKAIKVAQAKKAPATTVPVPGLTLPAAPAEAEKSPAIKPVSSFPGVPGSAQPTVQQQRSALEDILGDDFAAPEEPQGETPDDSVNPAIVHYSETSAEGAAAGTSSSATPYEYKDGVWQKTQAKDSTSKGKTSAIAAPATKPADATSADQATDKAQAVSPDALVTSEDDPFGWDDMQGKELVRVIAINLKSLESGDWQQNIVIRENDIIRVPPMPMGEFYVSGEVQRPGVYSLTGRKITLKMAIAAAGNLGPLAWPENSILIRRIGRNQEQTFPINLENIFTGQDPDIYLKPNDVIAVGTHWKSSFLAVLRNAFRMTYGFGFIYDRNFSDPLFVTPNSKRFTRL